MGCNGSKSVGAVIPEDQTKNNDISTDKNSVNAASTRPVTPQQIPPSMAFDIPFNDNEDDNSHASIVKKHPPKRLQRLEEQQQNMQPLSLEELQEKQQEAENRRQQFLQMRAQSAKRKYASRNIHNNNTDDNNTDDNNTDDNDGHDNDDKIMTENKEIDKCANDLDDDKIQVK